MMNWKRDRPRTNVWELGQCPEFEHQRCQAQNNDFDVKPFWKMRPQRATSQGYFIQLERRYQIMTEI